MAEMTTGARIRWLRERDKLTQEELAEALRDKTGRPVAAENLSRLEKDRNEPAAWMLRAMSDVFRTTVDYLLCLTKDPSPAGQIAYPIPAEEYHDVISRANGLPPDGRKRVAKIISETVSLYQLGENSQLLPDNQGPITETQGLETAVFDELEHPDAETIAREKVSSEIRRLARKRA